jgi:hypothetical protein
MKNYLILAMILIAGMTAYPQATRSARESKSEKSSTKKEAVRSTNRSESRSSGNRQEATRQKVETRQKAETRSADRPQATRQKVETRQKAETRSAERPQNNRSSNEAARSRVDTRSADREQAVRSANREQAVRSTNREQATRSAESPARKSQDATRVQSNTERRAESGNAQRSRETNVTSPANRSAGSGATRSMRESAEPSDRDFRVNTSSATRVYREGRGTLTRDDGTVIRHQNDEIFKHNKYKLDYDNYQNLRRSDDFRRGYRDYHNWYSHRHIRVVNHYHNRYIPVPWEVRRVRYYHRIPYHVDLIWTPLLFHRFMYYYPTHNYWDMEFGSRIETISAYESEHYAGTVRRVYGRVDEVYYSPADENYVLYIGAPFPYHDLSVVIPRHIARNISRSPKWYFEDEYVWIVGLINMWEGKPEIVVRDEDQIRKY